MSGDDKPAQFTRFGAIGFTAGFVAVYLLLDRAGHVNDLAHTEITPWAPHVAFLLFVVMYCGVRAAPLCILTPGIAECVWRAAPPLSMQFLGAIVCVGCSYTIAGLILCRMQRRYPQPTIAWFATFCVTIAIAALLDAAIYSAFLARTGHLAPGQLLAAVRTDWVGDVNGIIVLVPLSVILYMREPGKAREVRAHIGLLAVQTLALVGAFLLTFPEIWGFPQDDSRNPFYLLYLPIIWIALRWGASVTAVALAVLQLGIVAFVAPNNSAESFLAIQVLMVLLAGTGLFMAITVSEIARISQLMRSKDMELSDLNARMAVSEMNAAIGHELNNPLAALLNYLTSAKLLMELPVLDRISLHSTLLKAEGEASRSIAVVRKLREFFQSGLVRREIVDPRLLAREGLAAMQVKFRRANIRAVVEMAPDLPDVEADPLQLAMVLQNLLANAYDAVQATGRERRKITIRVTREGDEVMLSVTDSGTGIPAALQGRIFRPVNSTKPAGMGLGLAICRALVEANDGRIAVLRSDRDGTCIGFYVPVPKQRTEETSA